MYTFFALTKLKLAAYCYFLNVADQNGHMQAVLVGPIFQLVSLVFFRARNQLPFVVVSALQSIVYLHIKRRLARAFLGQEIQSRIQSPQVLWPAVGRQERLWEFEKKFKCFDWVPPKGLHCFTIEILR